jgi:hypothetical protein
MPIRKRDIRSRGIVTPKPVRQERELPFDDLIYLLAEGVATAQTKLDLSTAELLETLAETEVDVVPQLTRRFDGDGRVRTDASASETRSLLELGFAPTRYQFSEASVDIDIDISLSEQKTTDSESEERSVGLRAGTYELTEQRKYDREMNGNAQIRAVLRPVPLPVGLQPAESRREEADES